MRRWMTLAGYILVPGSHFGGMWRHPYSETDFCDRSLYEDVARTLERGGFDLAFVPESLSIATGPGGDYRTFVAHGAVGSIRHDPSHLVAAMAGVTRHLGFTVTLSTTYMEPYHIARIFSTLEHFSGGRMAWNIVTSAGESNAHNFGHFAPLDSPTAYRRADETLTVCSQLWTSWDEDALLRDKDSGRFADPDKVSTIDHAGEFFRLRGPLSLPATPGGGPVLMAAGVSPRGRDFAARWANVMFAIQNEAAGMAELRNDVRRRAEALGRDPASIRLLAAVQPVLGETRAIAAARAAYLDEIIHPEMARAFLAAMLGMDLARFAADTPIEEVIAATPMRAAVDAGAAVPWLDQVRAEDPDRNWTLGEIALRLARSSSTPRLVGTARDVADALEAFFAAEACDGFVITPTHFPGSFDEFARAVVPELRRRGLVRADPPPQGLRARLGL
ncbi:MULTISPECIES: NtaA/DmoA family FMN-dependent monooxygenase [unclassified Chelatococcus]|uniref:NtaA/DmoA family FMN-dependent monooxygenase n=1 Tax=unclassified Chelatococcus TaxID=2638111 RepID=UPI00038261CF|nr:MULTISPECIES: NtaA/DmoA family FMN-dependent monooxygenase [unclassified Chelatococcus]